MHALNVRALGVALYNAAAEIKTLVDCEIKALVVGAAILVVGARTALLVMRYKVLPLAALGFLWRDATVLP